MSEDPDSYRPKSPDLSGFVPPPHLTRIPSFQAPSDSSFPPGYSFSPRGSYDASPYFSPQNSQPSNYFGAQPHSQSPHAFSPQFTRQASISALPSQSSQQHSTQQSQTRNLPPTFPPSAFPTSVVQQDPYCESPVTTQHPEMPRTRARRTDEDQDAEYDPNNNAPARTDQLTFSTAPVAATSDVDAALTIDVRTKFPVARIKRIMQADEDVGKVAQATPTAVAKALEFFMITLILKGANTAKSQNSKRVTAQHLKSALADDKQFDFLMDCFAEIPDEDKGGMAKKGGRAKSEAEDSDEEVGTVAKKRKGSKRKASEESD